MTELIRGPYNITPFQYRSVLTLGNFDGVHQGHLALIHQVKMRAEALHVPSLLLTFEPHPLEYLEPKKCAARLTRWREKFCILKETGIDYVFVLAFNRFLSRLSPDDFIKKMLVDALHVTHVVVGDDFRFGYQRKGDVTTLHQAGLRAGFTVEEMPSFQFKGERVSSTLIREALAKGEIEKAKAYLGRPYSMCGRVVHGNKLGRKLGYPTANIALHRAVTPVQGIYAVRVQGLSEKALLGVANVGVRPAVSGTRALLEVHLFDFDRDIYGCSVKVEFCKKLRNEEYYENLDLLKNAIANDVEEAKKWFELRDTREEP